MIAANEEGQLNWKQKMKTVWKENDGKELLMQLWGQQTALSLLIQLLQMESTNDIGVLLRNNSSILQVVVQRTKSTRETLPAARATGFIAAAKAIGGGRTGLDRSNLLRVGTSQTAVPSPLSQGSLLADCVQ